VQRIADPVLDIAGRRVNGQWNPSDEFDNIITLDLMPGDCVDVRGDSHALPFGDESWAAVLCTSLLEHDREVRLTMAEIHRVLMPGGWLILTTATDGCEPYDVEECGGYYRNVSRDELCGYLLWAEKVEMRRSHRGVYLDVWAVKA